MPRSIRRFRGEFRYQRGITSSQLFSREKLEQFPFNTPPALEALATISTNGGARRRLRDDDGLRLAARAPSGSTYAAPDARRPGATAHVQRFVLAGGAHWVTESGEEVDSK